MSCLSADWQTTFLKLGAECLPFSQCTNCGDLRASPRTVIALRTPWKEAFSPQISPCLLQNSKRSPLIGGLGYIWWVLQRIPEDRGSPAHERPVMARMTARTGWRKGSFGRVVKEFG